MLLVDITLPLSTGEAYSLLLQISILWFNYAATLMPDTLNIPTTLPPTLSVKGITFAFVAFIF